MKRASGLLIILLFCFACKQKHEKKQAETVSKVLTKTVVDSTVVVLPQFTNPLLEQYATFLTKLDSNKAESNTEALQRYAAVFKGQPQLVCDTAVTVLSLFYGRLTERLNAIKDKDASLNLGEYYALDSTKDLKIPARVKAYVAHLKSNGFEVERSEGEVSIGQDRDFIKKWIYPYVSTAMKGYLDELNRENRKDALDDDQLVIKPEELADRTVWWEKFVKANPNFINIKDARTEHQDYLELLFRGTDNSSVKADNNKIDPYFARAYAYLKQAYPNTDAAKFAARYETQLAKSGDQADNMVKQLLGEQ